MWVCVEPSFPPRVYLLFLRTIVSPCCLHSCDTTTRFNFCVVLCNVVPTIPSTIYAGCSWYCTSGLQRVHLHHERMLDKSETSTTGPRQVENHLHVAGIRPKQLRFCLVYTTGTYSFWTAVSLLSVVVLRSLNTAVAPSSQRNRHKGCAKRRRAAGKILVYSSAPRLMLVSVSLARAFHSPRSFVRLLLIWYQRKPGRVSQPHEHVGVVTEHVGVVTAGRGPVVGFKQCRQRWDSRCFRAV